MKKSKLTALSGLMCLYLSGCTTITGYPDRSADIDSEIKSLAQYFEPNTETNCRNQTDAVLRRSCRDNIVDGRIRAIDINFNLFQKALFREGVLTNVTADWAVVALNAAGTVTGGAGAKAALAAASGGLVGAKGNLDKEAYFEKTMPAILCQMVAERKKVLARIREGMSLMPLDGYPLSRALIDVEDYYAVGTIPGAISAVTQDAGEKSQNADDKMEIVFNRTAGSISPENLKKVKAINSAIDNLSDEKAISLNDMSPTDDSKLVDAGIVKRGEKNPVLARKYLRVRATFLEPKDIDVWEKALGKQ